MTISSEDLKTIRKFQDIMSRGYYCSGQEVTDLHNKVLGTRLNSTNCGACIRTRIQALVEAADKFERMIQLEKKEEPAEEPKEETKKPKAKK